MSCELSSLLATSLVELRGYWLEEQRCTDASRLPVCYHAARHPNWLLSDLAFDHTCPCCGVMPALALLTQDRAGYASADGRIEVADRIEDG